MVTSLQRTTNIKGKRRWRWRRRRSLYRGWKEQKKKERILENKEDTSYCCRSVIVYTKMIEQIFLSFRQQLKEEQIWLKNAHKWCQWRSTALKHFFFIEFHSTELYLYPFSTVGDHNNLVFFTFLPPHTSITHNDGIMLPIANRKFAICCH